MWLGRWTSDAGKGRGFDFDSVPLVLAPDRRPRQHPTTQFFTGRMPFPPPNQQRQSTEGAPRPIHVGANSQKLS